MTTQLQSGYRRTSSPPASGRPDDWRELGRCRTSSQPDLWHSRSTSDIAYAKAICGRCPVQARCLTWATDTGKQHGVWGGLSEKDRRRARRDGTQVDARLCENCEQPIGPTAQRFCSRACARRQPPRWLDCGHCGTRFVATSATSRYCSPSHRSMAHRTRHPGQRRRPATRAAETPAAAAVAPAGSVVEQPAASRPQDRLWSRQEREDAKAAIVSATRRAQLASREEWAS